MTFWRLILLSLLHYRRLHLAVALGVAVGTAVLTGALLVGDSVRGSLRELTFQRLGPVDEVLIAPRFFRQDLAIELAGDAQFKDHFSEALPVIMLRASMLNPQQAGASADSTQPGVRGLTGRVNVLGCDERFWKLWPSPSESSSPPKVPGPDEIVLNQTLADEINAAVGQEVVLRLPKASAVPSETTLGRKTENWETRRLTVVGIVPIEGLGRFGIYPNQQLPLNAYTSLGTLQAMLDQPDRANAILVTGRQGPNLDPPAEAAGKLQSMLKPRLADYGVSIDQTKRGYFNVTSDALLLEGPLEEAAAMAFVNDHSQGALSYLANYITAGEKDAAEVPYSIATAVDFRTEPPLGPWRDVDGNEIKPLADDQIVLNQWTFDDLNKQLAAANKKLQIGDDIRLTYFLPDQTGGRAEEGTATFKLAAVVPLDDSSPARDPDFTPTVKGVTDRQSIANWDPPFPYYSERVRDEDEEYWKDFKTTPKVFISLKRGQELWGSRRFGKVTSIRVPPSQGSNAAALEEELEAEIKPDEAGFRFQAVKRLGLQAASGTTPFGVLFLSFSAFIIAAAAMLVGLLFRLMIENRAGQVGLLLASGFSRARVRRLLAAEGLIVAAAGGLLGAPTGCGYAWLMLYGLRTWWVDAVSTPFLHLHVDWLSLAIGWTSGVAVALAAIWFTLRLMRRVSLRRLLSGQTTEETSLVPKRTVVGNIVAVVALLSALGLAGWALTQAGQAQAGTFFGSGILMLIAGLAWLRSRLRSSSGKTVAGGGWPLVSLAARNGARNPGRSLLTVGLMASATFLIAALSAFRMDPTSDTEMLDLAERLADIQRQPDADRPEEPRVVQTPAQKIGNRLDELQRAAMSSGTGGFTLVAESALPILRDINERRILPEEGVQDVEIPRLKGITIYSLRMVPGEDASCRNLYQSQRPRILGVPQRFRDRAGFAWASTSAVTKEQQKNPWRLLDTDAGKTADGRPYIPVVIDMNTAMYSLHLYTVGSTLEIEDDLGRKLPLKLVGMLSNSILQGDVLMSEENVIQHFPRVTGYRFFLIEAAPTTTAARLADQERVLETRLVNYGLDIEHSAARLRDFLMVQNTYLATFQSLAALGVLLGTFGLAVVQLRNVLERRAELALMRATGFRRWRLAEMVLAENTLLLIAGLGLGVLAAVVAVLPQIVQRSQSVPWLYLAATLGIILAAGFAAGFAAVRATLKAPLVAALRGD